MEHQRWLDGLTKEEFERYEEEVAKESKKVNDWTKVAQEFGNVWQWAAEKALWADNKCEICEKAMKEEKIRNKANNELVGDLIKKLEALKVIEGDILLVRVDPRKPGVREMIDTFKHIFSETKKKDVHIIVIPIDMVLEKIDLEAMNPSGWYRKEQLIDPKLWEKKRDKKIHRRIIMMED